MDKTTEATFDRGDLVTMQNPEYYQNDQVFVVTGIVEDNGSPHTAVGNASIAPKENPNHPYNTVHPSHLTKVGHMDLDVPKVAETTLGDDRSYD